jgi:hypothetical protein
MHIVTFGKRLDISSVIIINRIAVAFAHGKPSVPSPWSRRQRDCLKTSELDFCVKNALFMSDFDQKRILSTDLN